MDECKPLFDGNTTAVVTDSAYLHSLDFGSFTFEAWIMPAADPIAAPIAIHGSDGWGVVLLCDTSQSVADGRAAQADPKLALGRPRSFSALEVK